MYNYYLSLYYYYSNQRKSTRHRLTTSCYELLLKEAVHFEASVENINRKNMNY